ncbi:gluconate 2-dehydrogenase subunit 3 family protein [Polymorphobacter sp. PAMC 29334]|uniref:gluconate 2-dehydrogenase subunit 3 family protein n=1 Tax=Polymorphobacter sp. PAMC 29334 TaxID=2862331 RepID=UPI001C6747DB|nr:gluconate 2-dehydrogenase subunit 3 family protein [Polymorphobacter sp. PAMC 29334]QYE34068.1 gluconate 2-dehydrogenase subunit 3 family protein [Polymorphobacter sp. PAMC 29334]
MTWLYPAGSVGNLIASDHVAEPTRAALQKRMASEPTGPRFFDSAEFDLLRAVCARLIVDVPQVDIAGAIDARLADGTGDGWRYDVLPSDDAAYRQGLRTIEATAKLLGGAPYVALALDVQDAVLVSVQKSSRRWFEELLAEATETAYAHPAVQDAIGYAGFADLPGWAAIGLDERDAQEPVDE